MGPWFPQSIQKRLLLYLLQKISLFSHVNITNLDISLGSNSSFTFNDLELDIDDIKIPNIFVRSGHIEKLEICLGINGALNINGKGLVFTIKLITEGCNFSSEGLAHSLAKSMLDITNSMMLLTQQNDYAEQYDDVDVESSTSSGSDDGNITPVMESTSPFTIETMRNKALDIALSKLFIKIEDVKVVVLLPNQNSLDIIIKVIQSETKDNIREIIINDLSFLNSCDKNVSNIDNDDMMSSSIIYTKKEATSIYMSALNTTMDNIYATEECKEAENEIMFLDRLKISFIGFASVNDLNIRDIAFDCSKIEINVESCLSTCSSLLSTLINIFQQGDSSLASQTLEKQRLQNYRRFQEEQDIMDSTLFISSIRIAELQFNLGEFLTLKFDNITYHMDTKNIFTIIINALSLKHREIVLLESKIIENPIIFIKYDRNISKTTCRIKDKLQIKLTIPVIKIISRLSSLINKFLSRIYVDKPHRHNSSVGESTWIFDIPSIQMTFEFDQYAMELQINNISIFIPNEIIRIEYIILKKLTSVLDSDIVRVESVIIKKNYLDTQDKIFDLKFNEVTTVSTMSGSIKMIRFNDTLADFLTIFNDLVEVFNMVRSSQLQNESISNQYKVTTPLLKKSVKLLNKSSTLHKHKDSNILLLSIDKIEGHLHKIYSTFGDIIITANKSSIVFGRHEIYQFYSMEVSLDRSSSDKVTNIISLIRKGDITKPCVLLHKNTYGKIKICIRNLVISYHTNWLIFLNSSRSDDRRSYQKKDSLSLEIIFYACALSLNPSRLNSILLIVMEKSVIEINTNSMNTKGVIKLSTLMIIDDSKYANHEGYDQNTSSIVQYYTKIGYVAFGKVTTLSIFFNKEGDQTSLRLEVDSLNLSLCADSLNTVVQTFIDLRLPVSFPDEKKYKNSYEDLDVMKDVDMEFFTGLSQIINDSEYIHPQKDVLMNNIPFKREKISEIYRSIESLNVQEDYFDYRIEDQPSQSCHQSHVNLKVYLTMVKSSIKLYDGYAWKYTRNSISSAVNKLQRQIPKSFDHEFTGTNLFDSIYLFVPDTDVDLQELISEQINPYPDLSYQKHSGRIKLRPSKYYKVRIDLSGIYCEFINYQVDEISESESSWSSSIVNTSHVSIDNFEIIDNVPTSTWNKFVTRLKGQNKYNMSPLMDISVSMIRPIDFLCATELVLSMNITPLRLHADQDTVEFLSRFLGFKDKRFELIDEFPDIVYIEKFKINSVDLKLDYKPKKVNYKGLRSGNTSEFMNFFILDGAKITLKPVILYGICGFSELGNALKNIWTPDITQHQLTAVLSGLSPIKSLVNLSSGVKALISLPIKEYQQDRSIARSLEKGARVFFNTTTGELVHLGVKMTSGTQAALENAEKYFSGQEPQVRRFSRTSVNRIGMLDAVIEEKPLNSETLVGGIHLITETSHKAVDLVIADDERVVNKTISLYADQPLDTQQGLQEAYNSLETNMGIAYKALKKAHRDIKESNELDSIAATVTRTMPVALLRPLIGATEAVSKTLQGISNHMDQEQVIYRNDKYKSRKR